MTVGCDSVGVQVLLANPPTPLCEALRRYGFLGATAQRGCFLPEPSLSDTPEMEIEWSALVERG